MSDVNTNDNDITNTIQPPKRFIFSMEDMAHFKVSPAKKDLLGFVTALGKSTASASYAYKPLDPLIGLSPGMASLHGSLRGVGEWIKELPPDVSAARRFGNPMFKHWHRRLTERSSAIISSIMSCHMTCVLSKKKKKETEENLTFDMGLLQECEEKGYKVALGQEEVDEQDPKIVVELKAYLEHSFGHEIRLDYGTGHECAFFVFLYCLCKIGTFSAKTTSPSDMAPVAISIVSQYLQVCRGIQTDYMLEPAGSHGVWGLDDYHCLPFYIGACQMQNPLYEGREYLPSSIHRDNLLNSKEGEEMMYFQCIRYIKSLKKGVPFFESSPMLDDISNLPNWTKVSSGLLRLFEGEVLDKKPVVQHFVFGDIFSANWIPSQTEKDAPTSTFSYQGQGEVARAPWAMNEEDGSPDNHSAIHHTKAPWAK
jgi:hypothetical protein